MKTGKKLASILLAGLAAFSVVGCGGGGGGNNLGVDIDENKQQIYVYAVENGMGYKWVEHFAEEFNAKEENSAYQIVPMKGTMDLLSTLDSQLSAGVTDVNIYFGCQSAITPMIAANKMIDISDVYQMKVDGEDKGTIAEKTFNYDLFKKAFSDLNGEGVYAVPYSIGFGGLMYDYDYFMEKGFLKTATAADIPEITAQGGKVAAAGKFVTATEAFGNYEAGDRVLTPGKDGTYGTYDDGQVTTYAEYKTLLAKIMGTNEGAGMIFPYLYTTRSVNAYTPVVTNAIFAQNMGYDNYYNFMSLNGDITAKDGTVEKTLTPATGKEAYNTQTIKNAYNAAVGFYHENIMGYMGTIDGVEYSRTQLIHKSSYNTTGTLHTDAQNTFIIGPTSKQLIDAAFLVEGTWWENEAKQTFNGLASVDESRGYGKRDYRYYLFPSVDTQITAADTSVIACQDDGCGVLLNNVPKKLKEGITREDFIKKCKEFLAYTLRDEALAYYTATEGSPRPFNYSLTPEQYNGLTKFQQNCWDLSHDTEHIQIVYPNITNNLSIVRSFGGLELFTTNKIEKEGTSIAYTTPYDAFKSVSMPLTLSEYLNGIYANVNETYDACYNKVKDYIK